MLSDRRAHAVLPTLDLDGLRPFHEGYEMPKTDNGVASMPAGKAAWFKDPHGNLLGLIQFDDPT